MEFTINKIKQVFDEDIRKLDLGPREQAFNNNPNLTASGAVSQTALNKWDEVLGTGYSLLLAKPSDYLNRDPLFRWSFYTLAEDIMPFMTDNVKKQFIVGAKPWIDKSPLYKNLLNFAYKRKFCEVHNQSIIVSYGGEIKSQTYLTRIIDNINVILQLTDENKLERKDLITFIGQSKYRLRILPEHIFVDEALLEEYKKLVIK